MYTLIKRGMASKSELEECYTLDEALKLYWLMRVDDDVAAGMSAERKTERKR